MNRVLHHPPHLRGEALKEHRGTTFLLPGEMVHCEDGRILATVLGSCVSICIWHEASGFSGMNHYLLPEHPTRGAQRGRHGPSAIEDLFRPSLQRGIGPAHCQVHLLGGAEMMVPQGQQASIGQRNVEVA